MTTQAIDERRAAKRRADRHRYRDTKLAYLLLAPVVILLGIFVAWPAVYAAFLSFQDWSFYKDPQFVGGKNYVDVLTDPLFVATIGRGFLFVLMTVPPMLVLAFLFASLVVSVSRRFATVLKVSIYIPTIISSVIASIVFVLIYTYDGGILNAVLAVFHIDPVAWIGDPAWALLSVAVPAVTVTRLCTALLDNAVQHAPRRSSVTLSVASGDGPGRGFVEFRVVDRGPGIRAEDRERIFTRFARGPETGRRRGFGLGLALVRDMATRYGGSVGIEDTSDAGTTFLLRLPAAVTARG